MPKIEVSIKSSATILPVFGRTIEKLQLTKYYIINLNRLLQYFSGVYAPRLFSLGNKTLYPHKLLS